MRVTTVGTNQPTPLPGLLAAHRGRGPAADARSAQAAASGYTHSPDLARLLDRLKAEPEVRPDAVQTAMDKIAAGELSTPQAAADAADAIVDPGPI